MMPANTLALDYGSRRVGVALAASDLKISQPLATLASDEQLITELKKLVAEHQVSQLVVGLPRNLDGDDTAQTASARQFASTLETELALPVYLVDEAATSLEAEARLKQSGKPYLKGEIDALAAAIILDDFLANYETN